MSGLKQRFKRLGFMKPVGQMHIPINNTLVDKDAYLFKECFQLEASYQEMSPIVLPKGFTRDFLDQKISCHYLEEEIRKAFHKIASTSDFVVVEGTGHTGVGSILGLNNAQVAHMLGLEIVIVATAGLGMAFDEIALNRAMCASAKATLKGVILNKVFPEKQAMIQEYFPKALQKWQIPLLGTIPYNNFLSLPCMQDFALLFETDFLSGHEKRYAHFSHTRLVDTSLKLFREADIADDQLIITPATREDIILASLAKYWNNKLVLGLILTGRHPPRPALIEKIKKTHIPCLWSQMSSFRTMQKITSFTTKIRLEDAPKVQKAIDLVTPHIDFATLIDK